MLHKLTEKTLTKDLGQSKHLSVCELVLEYGSSLFRSKDEKAILWLRACQELVIAQEDDKYLDIRVVAVQNLARAYLAREEEGDLDQVASILDYAAQDYPVASWLYLLKVEYAAKRYSNDATPMATLLESMIRIVQLTQPIFQSLMRKIHDLHKLSLQSACKVIDILLPKTAEADEADWIERVLVTRIWLATQFPEDQHIIAIDSLVAAFNGLEKKLARDLSPKATHASQIVSRCTPEILVLIRVVTLEGL